MIARQFQSELRKLLARKRTWLGFATFAALALVMPAMLHLPKVTRGLRAMIEARGYAFDDYFSGLTLALLTMRATIFFVSTLFLALVAGESVAKEVEDATMRMILSRPITRFRLLAMKYATVVLYTVALVCFIGLVALGAGLLYAGPGGFFAFGFQEQVSTFHPFADGLRRYLLTLPLLSISLLTVSSLGFMWSCFPMKPATATIAALTAFFVDLVFRTIPLFESIRPWLITTRMGSWLQVYQASIPWPAIIEDYSVLLALHATCFVVGWMVFERRDLKGTG